MRSLITQALNKGINKWYRNAYGLIGVTAFLDTDNSQYYFFSPTKKEWMQPPSAFANYIIFPSNTGGISAFGTFYRSFLTDAIAFVYLKNQLVLFKQDLISWHEYTNLDTYDSVGIRYISEAPVDVYPTNKYVFYITHVNNKTKIYRVDTFKFGYEPIKFICEVDGIYNKIAVNNKRFRFYLYNQSSNTVVSVYAFYPYTIEFTKQFDGNIIDSFSYGETQLFLLNSNKIAFLDDDNKVFTFNLPSDISNPLAVSNIGTKFFVLSNSNNATMSVFDYEEIFEHEIEEEQEEPEYPDPEPESLSSLPNIYNIRCEIDGLEVNQDTLKVTFGQYYIEGSVLAIADTLFQIPPNGTLYFYDSNHEFACLPVQIKITDMVVRQVGDKYEYEINFIEDVQMLYETVSIEALRENWWAFYYILFYSAGITITNWFNYTKGGELYTIKFEGERKKLLEEIAKRTGCYVFRDYSFLFQTGLIGFRLVSMDEIEVPYREVNGVIEKVQFNAGIDYNSIIAVNWLEDNKKAKKFKPITNQYILYPNAPETFDSFTETVEYYYNNGYNYVGYSTFIGRKYIYVPLNYDAYNSLTNEDLRGVEITLGDMKSACEVNGALEEGQWYYFNAQAKKNYSFSSFKYVSQGPSGDYSFLTNFNWNVEDSIIKAKIENGFLVLEVQTKYTSDEYATHISGKTPEVFKQMFRTLASYDSSLFEDIIFYPTFEPLSLDLQMLSSTYEHPYMEYKEDGTTPVCFVEERFASGIKALRRLAYSKKAKDGSKLDFEFSEEKLNVLPGEWALIQAINEKVLVDSVTFYKGFFVHKAFKHKHSGSVFKTGSQELVDRITEKQFKRYVVVRTENDTVYVLKNNEVVSFPIEAGVLKGSIFVVIDEYAENQTSGGGGDLA